MATTAYDKSRVPVEIARAPTAAGHFPELLELGLSVRCYEDRWHVLGCYGAELAMVPTYWLREVDPELLRLGALAALEEVPTHVADQLVAAIAAGHITVIAPPQEDWIDLHVGPDDFALMACHLSRHETDVSSVIVTEVKVRRKAL